MTWQEWAKLLVALAAPLLGFAGAWFATRWALGRFYKERVWERKAAAYTVIFECLHDMLMWHQEHLDATMRYSEIPKSKEEKLEKDYQTAKETMRRRIAAESWLLDGRVETRIVDMMRELKEDRDSWFDILDEGLLAMKNAQADMRTIAREDLAIG